MDEDFHLSTDEFQVKVNYYKLTQDNEMWTLLSVNSFKMT